MASVDSIERAGCPAPEPDTSIWVTDVEQQGKTSRRKRAIVCAGMSVVCGALLALALFFGLSESFTGAEDAGQIDAQQSSSTNLQTDHNALGCFTDSQTNRTLVLEVVDPEGMTPDVSDRFYFRTAVISVVLFRDLVYRRWFAWMREI